MIELTPVDTICGHDFIGPESFLEWETVIRRIATKAQPNALAADDPWFVVFIIGEAFYNAVEAVERQHSDRIDEAHVRLSLEKHTNCVIITCEDNGPGGLEPAYHTTPTSIAMPHRTPFQSQLLHRPIGGKGTGLQAIISFVTQPSVAGAVEIGSSELGGTAISMSIPRKDNYLQ